VRGTKTAVLRRVSAESNTYTFLAPKILTIPVAVTAWPDNVDQTPRDLTERANLVDYNKVGKGGHFGAGEQPPQLLAERFGPRSPHCAT
jgi:hypothetical protein